MKQLPDRKVWAGGLAGLIGWAAATWLGLPQDAATALAAALWGVVSYFVPPSLKEAVMRANSMLKKAGKQGEF